MDKWLNIIGLICNFLGTLLLWKYVVPSALKVNNKVAILSTETVKQVVDREGKYKIMAGIGLSLIALGFLLQLITAI